jgi:hypothetical protein
MNISLKNSIKSFLLTDPDVSIPINMFCLVLIFNAGFSMKRLFNFRRVFLVYVFIPLLKNRLKYAFQSYD